MTTIHMARLRQDARDLYVGAMRAADVIRLGRVAEWKDDEGDGYQRAPERPRINKLATFLKNESIPLLPTSILLSHRGEPLPKTELAESVFAIDVADHEVLWIVDGQHRVGGLQTAIEKIGLERFKEFQLPVVLMEFEDVTEEAHQFQLINENMKKVNTSSRGVCWRCRCRRGVRGAQADPSGPSPVGSGFGRRHRALTCGPRLHVVRPDPVPEPDEEQGPRGARTLIQYEPEAASSRMIWRPISASSGSPSSSNNYWEAWRQIAPEAFEEPDEHVIQKTPGIFSLHLVAKFVLRLFDYRKNAEPQRGRDPHRARGCR